MDSILILLFSTIILISDYREKKDESQKIDKEDKRDSLFDLEIKKYMKKSPNEGLTHPRFSLAKKPSNDKKWSFKGLMSIPEVNDEPFLNKVSGKTSEASYKRVQYHKRTEKISKKELISLLLSGEHEVFKHRSPQTRNSIPEYNINLENSFRQIQR